MTAIKTSQRASELAASNETSASYDVLTERVRVQGTNFEEHRAATAREFTSLKSFVTEEINSVSRGVERIAVKLDQVISDGANQGRFQLGSFLTTACSAIAVSVILIGGYVSLVKAPIEDKQLIESTAIGTLTTDLKALTSVVQGTIEHTRDAYISRSELEDRRATWDKRVSTDEAAISKIIDGFVTQKSVDKDAAVIAKETEIRIAQNQDHFKLIDQKLEDQVGRHEHELRWAEFQRELDANRDERQRVIATLEANLQRQIDDTKKRLDDLYPAHQFLEDLNARTRVLEEKVWTQPK